MRTLPKLRPPVKTHGGKSYLARRIVNMFPPHTTYVEPFAGGLSVLLNKPRSKREIAGDLNAELIRFLRTLRDQPGELIERLRTVAYTEQNFEWACEPVKTSDPNERAARFLVRNRFSRSGLGEDFAWSDRKRGGRPGDENAWLTIQEMLPLIASRLRGVELYHADALQLIRRFDGPNTLHYLDPPYVHSTRTARNTYRHEMTNQDHERLLHVLRTLRGKVVLSGYHSDLYDSALEGWHPVEFEMANHSGQTKIKSRRVEVLWLNPACDGCELGSL